MIYLGKEYKFRFSVQVSINVAQLCPGKDLRRLGEVLAESGTDRYYQLIALMAKEMNRAYLINERFESGTPMKDWGPIEPMSEELVYNMDAAQFVELTKELLSVYQGQSKPTQIVEPAPAQKKIVNISDQQG